MRTITLIDFQNDPNLRRKLEREARSERARHIVLFLKSLFEKDSRHAARSHLAAQG